MAHTIEAPLRSVCSVIWTLWSKLMGIFFKVHRHSQESARVLVTYTPELNYQAIKSLLGSQVLDPAVTHILYCIRNAICDFRTRKFSEKEFIPRPRLSQVGL